MSDQDYEHDKTQKRLEASRLNEARARARKGAIEDLHRQARTGDFDPSGRYAWDQMSADEQEAFIETKQLPDDYEFSHLYSAKHYPEIAHEPSSGRLTRKVDHRFGDHGGDTKVPLHGAPRDPNWKEGWGAEVVDGNTKQGAGYLGLTRDDEKPNDEKVDASLKRSYPELRERIEKRRRPPREEYEKARSSKPAKAKGKPKA